MARYRAHFVLDDQLVYTIAARGVLWQGVVYCADGIEIHVSRFQEVRHQRGRLMVRTKAYSYHVLQRVGSVTRSLVRYDNIHEHPGHRDAHQRHEYDAAGNEVIAHVGAAGWPTLGDVIDETYAWLERQRSRDSRDQL
ncbi:MAG: hypothetical protein HYU88_02325 [Chloroflexi bacterium]|nr:hypothetical protein [Chloroflexota bacterium]MBI4505617.1 hypothetical protein [Chloroflexota bacterium]